MMNQNKKAKIANLLLELNNLKKALAIEQKLVSRKTINSANNALNNDIYTDVLTLALNKKAALLEPVQSWKKHIQASKIVKSAQKMILLCNTESSNLFIEFADALKYNLTKINSVSQLTPKYGKIKPVITAMFEDLGKSVDKHIYDSYLPDIFNQGRFHELLFKPQNGKLQKFALKNFQEEIPSAKNLIQKYRNELTTGTLAYVQDETLKEIKALLKTNISFDDLCVDTEQIVLKYVSNFQNTIQKHLTNIYLEGNLYQLAKDNVEWVTWQTGQTLHDCGECRAKQMGDIILNHNGKELPHIRADYDKVIYPFKVIREITSNYGATVFNHTDCLCTFLEYKKEPI